MARHPKNHVKSPENCLKTLKVLKRLKGNDLTNILDRLSDETIDELCTVIYNFMYSELPGQTEQREKVRNLIEKNRNKYQTIVNSRTGVGRRRKLLVEQSGEGLGALLAVGIPLIANLISSLKKK